MKREMSRSLGWVNEVDRTRREGVLVVSQCIFEVLQYLTGIAEKLLKPNRLRRSSMSYFSYRSTQNR
jgi:uncharacterized membrane protein